MRTLIIRLFSPVGEEATRLQGLVQRPGRHAVRFLGPDQLVEAVRRLGWDDDPPGPHAVPGPDLEDPAVDGTPPLAEPPPEPTRT